MKQILLTRTSGYMAFATDPVTIKFTPKIRRYEYGQIIGMDCPDKLIQQELWYEMRFRLNKIIRCKVLEIRPYERIKKNKMLIVGIYLNGVDVRSLL